MTMVPRDPITVQQIKEAKESVPNGDEPEDIDEETVDAAKTTGSAPSQAPVRNPGYAK